MRIPNAFLTTFKSSELKLACAFYSLINSTTEQNLLGYVVTVKQDTLARICGCSISTIKRTLALLRQHGFIKSQKRNIYVDNNSPKYGTYSYIITAYNLNRNYFYLNKKSLSLVSGQAFVVYANFCKLAKAKSRNFYQSLNDLVKILKMNKSDIVRSIKKLINDRLIIRHKKRTYKGDYTDNTYIICIANDYGIKKAAPLSGLPKTLIVRCSSLKTTYNLYYIFYILFCQAFEKKIMHFYLLWGSMKYELSIINPLYYLSEKRKYIILLVLIL